MTKEKIAAKTEYLDFRKKKTNMFTNNKISKLFVFVLYENMESPPYILRQYRENKKFRFPV